MFDHALKAKTLFRLIYCKSSLFLLVNLTAVFALLELHWQDVSSFPSAWWSISALLTLR